MSSLLSVPRKYNSISLDDKCQFWLQDNARILTSPYFDIGQGAEVGSKQPQNYYNNLNCTWILKAEQGSYINFDIELFWVKNHIL